MTHVDIVTGAGLMLVAIGLVLLAWLLERTHAELRESRREAADLSSRLRYSQQSVRTLALELYAQTQHPGHEPGVWAQTQIEEALAAERGARKVT